MASTWDSNLFSIEKMSQGDKIGTWGDVTNLNWESIQRSIGYRTEIDIDSLEAGGSSTYSKVGSTGTLTLLLPDATSPTSGTDDAKSRSCYISVTGVGQGVTEVILKICGNSAGDKVDRVYFIRNNLSDTQQPFNLLKVRNAGAASGINIKRGNTVALSFSSDIGLDDIVDVLSTVQVDEVDFSNATTGEITLQEKQQFSLKANQYKEDNTTKEVLSVDTRQGVTSVTGVTAGSGYTQGEYDLTFSAGGGSGAKGTFTVSGAGNVLIAPGDIVVTEQGTGYTSAPTVSFTNAATSGTAATATAVIGEASVVDLTSSTTKITKGVIEQTRIGATTPLSGKFTTLESTKDATVGGNLSVSGNATLGSDATDTVTFTGSFDGSLTPANNATSLGSESWAPTSKFGFNTLYLEDATSPSVSFYESTLATQVAEVKYEANTFSIKTSPDLQADVDSAEIFFDNLDQAGNTAGFGKLMYRKVEAGVGTTLESLTPGLTNGMTVQNAAHIADYEEWSFSFTELAPSQIPPPVKILTHTRTTNPHFISLNYVCTLQHTFLEYGVIEVGGQLPCKGAFTSWGTGLAGTASGIVCYVPSVGTIKVRGMGARTPAGWNTPLNRSHQYPSYQGDSNGFGVGYLNPSNWDVNVKAYF